MKNAICTLLFGLIVCGLAGCGGGWGKLHELGVVYQSIDVNRFDVSPMKLEGDKTDPQISLEVGENFVHQGHTYRVLDKQDLGIVREEFFIDGRRFYGYSNFSFDGKEYRLAVRLRDSILILDSDDKIVAKLRTSSYASGGAAISVDSNGNPLLVVVSGQQPTSNSSAVFVLNSDFDVQYKEQITDASNLIHLRGESGMRSS